jgi:hypothetical protein
MFSRRSGGIEAGGIRLLFDDSGAPAGSVRQGVSIDPSALSSQDN